MLFHNVIAEALADQGVSTIFGLLGDANLYPIESFVRTTGGSLYSVTHESAGVLAANAYAQVTGGLGVATVTHGAALTNSITALVECVKSRTPLLLIAGDTPVVDTENWQNIPQRDVILGCGAGFEQVRAPHTIADDVATSIRRAWSESRPIVLNVPTDFEWQEIDHVRAPRRFVPRQAVCPDPQVLDVAVGVIASARRPVVVAGRGAIRPEAKTALLRLARRIGAPIATTLRGKDLFRGDPFNLGIAGTLSHEVALDTINESDCVIVFGAGLNAWTSSRGSLLRNKPVIHVDINPDSINRHAYVTVGVIGDAAAVADMIVSYLDAADVSSTGFASPALAERLARHTDDDFTDLSTDSTVDIRTALNHLDRSFPSDRTLVLDGGRFVLHCFNRLHVEDPSAYVHAGSYASVGLGPGTAIGAAIGAPQRPVLHVCGDGGLMMSGLPEFNTAVRYGLDLVVIVLNDAAYGAEHIQLRNKGIDPSITMFEWPDFAQLATALGGQGFTARNVGELDRALDALSSRSGPVLIDVKLDPENVELVGL